MSDLSAPPDLDELNRNVIRTQEIQPSQWLRVTQHASGEPYFGESRHNRFADPSVDGSARYRTCYIGESLEVAVAETLLHDVMPQNGGFGLAYSQVSKRHVVQFEDDQTLVLADLTGAALKTLVGSSELCTIADYKLPQLWAKALHQHPQRVDGLLYQSRHINNQKAVVVFDRATAKLGRARYTSLIAHPHWSQVQNTLNIRFEMP